MLAGYHNHSTWSDGSASIAEMLRRAGDLGMAEFGISDHYVLAPDGSVPKWSMPPANLDEYVKEVRGLQESEAMASVTLRLGLEVDWFPGRDEILRAVLEKHPFDYLIGSVHDVNGMKVDSSSAPWRQLSAEEREAVHRQYWINMRGLAESGLFDIAAHLDLTKKFGHRPASDLSREIGEALDAIAEADLVVELNTAGWHKPCAEAYPSPELLRECRRREIPVTLSADAHQPDHLLRDFSRGAGLLRDAGYEKVARFAGRERWFEPLDDAVL